MERWALRRPRPSCLRSSRRQRDIGMQVTVSYSPGIPTDLITLIPRKEEAPVPHCIKGTVGWEIDPRLETAGSLVIDKPTFGSVRLTEKLSEMDRTTGLESVELVGLCTDICVISNAMLIKAALPEVPVLVDPVSAEA